MINIDDLAYDPMTGDFWWLVCTGNRPKDRPAGNSRPRGYRELCWKGKSYPAHRLAWYFYYGELPTLQIDHINGNTGDNRIENLRLATPSLNKANTRTPRTNTSGYKGVTRQGKRWTAAVKHMGRRYYLGAFDTPEEAHAAYCCGAMSFFGEYANFG